MNPTHQLELDSAWYVQEFGVKAPGILRELQYYNRYGELPPDAVFIEKVEWVNGSAIIVHRDAEMRHD